MNSMWKVKSAAYGVLQDGNAAHPADVARRLEEQIHTSCGIVAITNGTMGGDPAPNIKKQFHATLTVNGVVSGDTKRENCAKLVKIACHV